MHLAARVAIDVVGHDRLAVTVRSGHPRGAGPRILRRPGGGGGRGGGVEGPAGRGRPHRRPSRERGGLGGGWPRGGHARAGGGAGGAHAARRWPGVRGHGARTAPAHHQGAPGPAPGGEPDRRHLQPGSTVAAPGRAGRSVPHDPRGDRGPPAPGLPQPPVPRGPPTAGPAWSGRARWRRAGPGRGPPCSGSATASTANGCARAPKRPWRRSGFPGGLCSCGPTSRGSSSKGLTRDPHVPHPHLRLPDERARLRAPGRVCSSPTVWSRPTTSSTPISWCSTRAASGRTPTTSSTDIWAGSRPCATRRPGMQIAVGGCLAQKDREAVRARAGHVDVVFGTHNLTRAPALLRQAATERSGGGDPRRPEPAGGIRAPRRRCPRSESSPTRPGSPSRWGATTRAPSASFPRCAGPR